VSTILHGRDVRIALITCTLHGTHSQAQIKLLAIGTLDQSRAGSFADLSGLTYTLENGAPANSLGGFGSALCYASGNTFLALPDGGPNAIPYGSNIDDTPSFGGTMGNLRGQNEVLPS
jgi:hypothetical protein